MIHLPGDDNTADIDLLNYPFICHELGHNILFRDGDAFITAFGQELDAALAAIQRQTLGIRGSARQVADATSEQVRRYWTPTSDQYNWAHEIAADVISTWLSGPAYLATLQDVMEADGLNPYQLGQSHPPYEIRARALTDAAGRLGWAYYTGAIQSLLDRWSSTTALSEERTNLHVACGDPRLLGGAVSAAIQTCEALSLPCCTPARIAALEDRKDKGNTRTRHRCHSCRLVDPRQSTDAAYQEWERATIDRVRLSLQSNARDLV